MIRALLVLLLLLAPALAQTDRLEAEIKRAEALEKQNAAQAAALRRELAALDAKSRALVKELKRLERELAGLEAERRRLALAVRRLEAQVAELKKKEEVARVRLDAYQTRLRALMLRLWYQQIAHRLPLVRAANYTELALKTRWLAQLSQADLALVEAAEAEARRLAEARKKLRAQQAALDKERRALAAKSRAVAAKRTEIARTLKALAKQKKAKAVRLAQLQENQAALDEKLKKLKAELERRRAEAARQARLSAVPKALVGRIMFPVPGGRIIHPYGKNGQNFEWIQAPKPASPVLAAADGQVFAVLFYGNIGWTVMLQHSDRLFTQYVNLQAPLVQTGDRVEQGEVIGYLGGGTLIAPNVLWFRVAIWKKGRFYYVDPADYY